MDWFLYDKDLRHEIVKWFSYEYNITPTWVKVEKV